jgi:predicted ester cyclase
MGIPPSGKDVEIRGINLYRISGGKMVEAESVVDMLAMMQQIGVVPTP